MSDSNQDTQTGTGEVNETTEPGDRPKHGREKGNPYESQPKAEESLFEQDGLE